MLEKARGKVLLVTDFTRLLRSKDFHAWRNPEARPDADELAALVKLGEEYGVTLMTVNDPDASPEEGRAFLQKVNGEVSKRGRPRKRPPGYRKAIREGQKGKAVRLFAIGVTVRDIAERVSRRTGIKVTDRTVRNWIALGES
jgi:DNA invertase Pin-like site-specific DNA recombinase